jgi:predicted nucleic acid-binding protein
VSDYFFDSSAVVKRYIQETGSLWVGNLFDPALNNEIFLASVTPIEVVAAITRRGLGGSIPSADAALACGNFQADWQGDYQTVELTEGVIRRAVKMAETHGLRGYDAVQLAAALEVNALCVANGLAEVIFVSGDNELNRVALKEGLVVEDPNNYP